MITQISRIQVRHGFHEDLPQLATGEFGWCLDSKQLYIGNGTIEEGAPNLGNTEILTEFSDVFTLRGVYTYRGERGTYVVQTGPSALAPVQRPLNDKLDDFANARDFGAVGDGVTDDTDALNRAIEQLYKSSLVSTQPLVRRTLYLPAGVYKITSRLKLLPFVTLRGDGADSTIILQVFAYEVMVTTDSIGEVGLSSGLNGAVRSQTNSLHGLTLQGSYDKDVLVVDNNTGLLCRDVKFRGPKLLPAALGNSSSAVLVTSNAVAYTDMTIPSQGLVFDNCAFSGLDFGVSLNNLSFNVNINKSRFSDLYRGVVIASGRNVNVTHSYFSTVAREGILSLAGVVGVVSAFNYFDDVGNDFTGSPVSSIVQFNDKSCYSLGDTFTRSDADLFPAVDYARKQSAAITQEGTLRLGTFDQYAGTDIDLLDNATVLTTIPGPTLTNNATFKYEITRNNEKRVGSLTVVKVGSTIQFDDEYNETNSVGVTLTPTELNGKIVLQYTSTPTSFTPTINLTVTTLS